MEESLDNVPGAFEPEAEVYKRLGQLEGKLDDAQAIFHRIANVHACLSCYYDVIDDMRALAEIGMKKCEWEE